MLPPVESQPPPSQRQRQAVDRLGDLPTEVLEKLLAGLPARDVVRTSVLSTPWRRRWESVPGLDIELHDVHDDEGAACAWWGSAAGFLERCAGPVGRVSIRGVPVSLSHRVDGWVRAVAGKSPRSLSLSLSRELPQSPALPSLFHCDPAALAELDLRVCVIPAPPPGFAGFQRLTKLDLDQVHLRDSSQLEAMISAAAPTLVELRLQFVTCLGFSDNDDDDGFVDPPRWVIKAPNLRRLVLRLWMDDAGLWELGPLPNLEFARIFLSDSAEEIDYYAQMFTAISNVRELQIGNWDIYRQAALINIFQDHLGIFKNLRILRIDANCYNRFQTINLFSLCPSLETIEFKRW